MIDVLQGILGAYIPVFDAVNGVPLSGTAGVNFEYLTAAVILIICIICVFKLFGVILRKF